MAPEMKQVPLNKYLVNDLSSMVRFVDRLTTEQSDLSDLVQWVHDLPAILQRAVGTGLPSGRDCQPIVKNSALAGMAQSWRGWLSGLSAGMKTKGSLVRLPIRAHAGAVGQVGSPVGSVWGASTH